MLILRCRLYAESTGFCVVSLCPHAAQCVCKNKFRDSARIVLGAQSQN